MSPVEQGCKNGCEPQNAVRPGSKSREPNPQRTAFQVKLQLNPAMSWIRGSLCFCKKTVVSALSVKCGSFRNKTVSRASEKIWEPTPIEYRSQSVISAGLFLRCAVSQCQMKITVHTRRSTFDVVLSTCPSAAAIETKEKSPDLQMGTNAQIEPK